MSIAQSAQEILGCFEVMRQLRPHIDEPETFLERVREQSTAGYQLLFARTEQHVIGCAGFVIGVKLAWGKHLYVDDLVVEQQHRSGSVGRLLIEWLEKRALEQECTQLHLDSGVQRFRAHKFYLGQDYQITSHHFQKTI